MTTLEELEKEDKVIIENKQNRLKIYSLLILSNNKNSIRKCASGITANKGSYKIKKTKNKAFRTMYIYFRYGIYASSDFIRELTSKESNKVYTQNICFIKLEKIND
jgi:hypothetical protein